MSPLFFCVSTIRHSASFWIFPGGWLLLFRVLGEWRIMTNSAYGKTMEMAFCAVGGNALWCPILYYLLCLMPDDFTCQGKSVTTQWVNAYSNKLTTYLFYKSFNL
jgi:hypothetical protein